MPGEHAVLTRIRSVMQEEGEQGQASRIAGVFLLLGAFSSLHSSITCLIDIHVHC